MAQLTFDIDLPESAPPTSRPRRIAPRRRVPAGRGGAEVIDLLSWSRADSYPAGARIGDADADADRERPMHFVDLFSGCGGLSQGFRDAGLTPLAAFERWDAARRVYNANVGNHAEEADLSAVDDVVARIRSLGIRPDLIAGGPPCQDFAHSGRRVEAARAELTVCFAEIVARVSTDWVVMENVDRALKSNAYSRAREILGQAGYGLSWGVLDASLEGVPQRRKRLFLIGRLGERDRFLDLRQPPGPRPTVADHFRSIGHVPAPAGLESYYRHPRTYGRQAIFSLDKPSPTIRGTHRPMPKGYVPHEKDDLPEGGSLETVRALASEERALIQTFPPGWRWQDHGLPKHDIDQMIGNAVPVRLAAAVARRILAHVRAEARLLAA